MTSSAALRPAARHRRRTRSAVLVAAVGLAVGLLPQVQPAPASASTVPASSATATAVLPSVGAGYSITAGGKGLYGTTQPAGAVQVRVTAPQPLVGVRMLDGKGRLLGTLTDLARDSRGQHVASGTVDLTPVAGGALRLVAQLQLPKGGTHGISTNLRVAAATAAPAPTPTPVVTPAPTPTPVVTPAPTPTPVVTPAPTPTPTTPAPVVTPAPTPVVTPAPTTPAPVVTPASTAVVAGTPLTAYGAVGDGRTDDTRAIQRAFDTAAPGTTLVVPAGKVFRHTEVLRLKRPDLTVAGTGTLLATEPRRSSLLVQGDRTTIRDVTLAMPTPTERLGTWDDMKLTVLGAKDVRLERVHVEGSAAAGIYFWGAQRFTLVDATVTGSKADGIHITGPSSDGTVVRPVVRGSGDDGVAVVSYAQDGQPVRRVTVTSPTVLGTSWGRGVTVVGGEDITYRDIRVERSNAAAVYIAKEPGWRTFAPVRVLVSGGTVREANQSTTVDHGAVLVWDGWANGTDQMRDVVVEDLTIDGTRRSASRQVGFLRSVGGTATGVQLRHLDITGGPSNLLVAQATTKDYRATDWSYNGSPVCVER